MTLSQKTTPLFSWVKIPTLLGWILALLSIEEATFAEDFLFSSPLFAPWGFYLFRLAFFLGIALALLLFSRYPQFPTLSLVLVSGASLGFSFLPLGLEGAYVFRFVFSLLSGASCGYFGLGFFLGFNNRQKGFSLALALALSPFLFWIKNEYIASLVLLSLPCLLLLFSPKIWHKETNLASEDSPQRWLLFLSFAAFVLCGALELSFLKGLFRELPALIPWGFGGSFVGILISLFFLKSERFLLSRSLYLAFGVSAMGGLFLFFAPNLPALSFSAFCFGSAHTMGLFSLYYVLGVYTKKYSNITFYNWGSFFSSLAYLSALLLSVFCPFSLDKENRYWGVLFVSLPLLLFLLVGGYFEKQSVQVWLNDFHREEVTFGDVLNEFLSERHFSPREKEVTRLLLKGLSLKQIALELHRSYSTINTYQNAIYRKLGINSRAELLLMCHPLLEKNSSH